MMPAERAWAAWSRPGRPRPVDGGLINGTWVVGDPPLAVLQWVNPIFSPLVNRDIDAITQHLGDRGLPTPRVLPTAGGALWVDDPERGCWRALSYVPGRTLHRLSSPVQARAAGALTGRFHRALEDYTAPRHAPVRRIHLTPARMEELEAALAGAGEHPLAAEAGALGARILADWARWEGELDLPERICHGDLKIANFRFHAERDEAVALIDLDTVGPMDLSCELGDAWRSWCNPAGEDDPARCVFDVALFEASLRGWWETGPRPEGRERAALVPGIERICLELAARFCADAVRNTYFREDRERFPQPGAHNLLKARCQHALAQSAREARSRCQALVEELAAAAPRH